MGVKFYSNQHCLFIGHRNMPGYVPVSWKDYMGGVSFDHDGVLEAEDAREIEGLRQFIKARGAQCQIWEEGNSPTEPFPVITEAEYEAQQAEERKKHEESEMMHEFYQYLTQRKFPNGTG